MKSRLLLLCSLPLTLSGADLSKPTAPADLLFEERNGLVAIEAEHFIEQTLTEKRAWHLTTTEITPDLKPDPDPSHADGASGGAYLEILPDTRATHAEKLIAGVNFTNEPGKAAILSYKVHFNTPGTYWLWARAYSTGTEDNGIHFGIDNTWPETAQRWQTVVKKKWHWKSAQRTAEKHGGVPGILTLDVATAGVHTIHVSMREDGFELDKILLVNRKDYTPEGMGPESTLRADSKVETKTKAGAATRKQVMKLLANKLDPAGSGYYLDQDKWLAINPDQNKSAKIDIPSPFPGGTYDITLEAVGENDGSSTYSVSINDAKIGDHTCPMATETFEEGPKYHATWKNVAIEAGDVINVSSTIASADGKEWSRARWAALNFSPADEATKKAVREEVVAKVGTPAPNKGPALQQPRLADGDGTIAVSGELKEWHKVTLTLDGPYAHEKDNKPNPFTDYNLTVTFTHESGEPSYTVPGYFAADGNAGESSAEDGTKWRAHLSPDKSGKWDYEVSFLTAPGLIYGEADGVGRVLPLHKKRGSFTIAPSDKSGRDFRAHGRLSYVGKHHLQHEGSKSFFLKAGADAPETLLAYTDFDGTSTRNKSKGPLKTWSAHARDWREGDPSWKDGKGKGLIGALNYLADKGVNAFSFLPYNVGGDGDNIWPFIAPEDKFHYDCSKLDQWGVVFDHATTKGLYLHFKLQETEIDDNRRGHGDSSKKVPSSLDGGQLGPQRMLYCRELVARFGHALALNWNIGEENTQSTKEVKDMVGYLRALDPYQHHVVIHTYPNQQNKVYKPLLGYAGMTGLSLQNKWDQTHKLTLQWIQESAKAGHPWVAANDEQGPANAGVPPDPSYPGPTKVDYTIDDIRKYTLWGNLMAGGAGVEYYFGYKLAENDLRCEDWRSRDLSWDYCRIALDFFRDENIPFQEMTCQDELIGNDKHDNSKYCLAKKDEVYLVYLPEGGSTKIELPEKEFRLTWFNPRTGEHSKSSKFSGDQLGVPDKNDWLAIIRE